MQEILEELDASTAKRKRDEPAKVLRGFKRKGDRRRTNRGQVIRLRKFLKLRLTKARRSMLAADEEVAVDLLSAAAEFLDATSKFAEKKAGRKSRKKAKRAWNMLKV